MTDIRNFFLSLLVFSLLWLNAFAVEQLAEQNKRVVSIGRVLINKPFEREIAFQNTTKDTLKIDSVQLTTPLIAKIITPEIKPGDYGKFVLSLGKVDIAGAYQGLVRVNFKDNSDANLEFAVEGYLVTPIEFSPQSYLVAVTQRGVPKEKSIEIINHRDEEPLKLTKLDYDSERFTATLQTLKPGQHYKINLFLKGEKKGDRKTEWIKIINEDKKLPFLKLMVNTFITEKIYTFPEAVDMGELPLKAVTNQEASDKLAQTLMIYNTGASNFEISASSDLETISFPFERGPKGDRYQFTVKFIPEKVKVGPIKGFITIKTNDADFPVVKVPVTGAILPVR